MTFSQAILAYVVSWWMVLLMVAPVAAHKTTDANRKKVWALKILATVVVAALVTWGIDIAISSGIVSVRS